MAVPILGRSGLEKLYDSILRGTDGGKQVEVDATGRPGLRGR